MSRFLEGVDRASMVKWTAVYFAVFAVLNVCVVWGGLSVLRTTGSLDAGLGLFFFISWAIFAIAAYGLWRRKAWARIGTIIALGTTIIISLVGSDFSYTNLIWILVSGAGIYFYLTDEGLKRELSH